MHEMGHVAIYKASRDQEFKQEFDYTRGGAGWNLDTFEHLSTQLEEGFATHLADVGLYDANAGEPRTCISQFDQQTDEALPCPAGNTALTADLETSEGQQCTPQGRRRPRHVARYLWDMYDINSDYSGDTFSLASWETLDNAFNFANGYDEDQKSEHWDSANGSIDEQDGRAAYDYMQVWFANEGVLSLVPYLENCGDTGADTDVD